MTRLSMQMSTCCKFAKASVNSPQQQQCTNPNARHRLGQPPMSIAESQPSESQRQCHTINATHVNTEARRDTTNNATSMTLQVVVSNNAVGASSALHKLSRNQASTSVLASSHCPHYEHSVYVQGPCATQPTFLLLSPALHSLTWMPQRKALSLALEGSCNVLSLCCMFMHNAACAS